MERVSRIISGGQTGVDRGALDAAIHAGMIHGGWCPAGGWAEDKPDHPGVLVDYPGLQPTADADPATRTRLNVRDAHATLVLTGGVESPGTELAVACARDVGRPALVLDDPGPTAERVVRDVLTWLDGVGSALILNVAGPRASEWPGGYDASRAVVEAVLRA
ncbi:putative molybdenum carrier protein [Demequina sp. NBRC 110053]|uniref:putative molybdenum carrier protein n=1 Tax=Demequina sp. NBRC 110053 TaxID=1570342 RepID=UPI000A01A10F|nr:putative molybdenum carrier protein [Demequina sp. NBRC 110053]